MKRENWYISTIDEKAQTLAAEHGLGIELAEYCTAWNMDVHFEETDDLVRKKLKGHGAPIFHAPFNELFPCAIDLKIREVARERYRQAFEVAAGYGVKKIVIHSGYNPRLYYPVWYTEQTIELLKLLIAEDTEDQKQLEACHHRDVTDKTQNENDACRKGDPCCNLFLDVTVFHEGSFLVLSDEVSSVVVSTIGSPILSHSLCVK